MLHGFPNARTFRPLFHAADREHGLAVAEHRKLGGDGAWVDDASERVLFIRHPASSET